MNTQHIDYGIFNNILFFKGRASHISQTWSAFANNNDRQNLLASPMAALNSSPLARNQSMSSSVSSNSFYSSNANHQSISPLPTSNYENKNNTKKHSLSFITNSDETSSMENDDNVFQGSTTTSVDIISNADLNVVYEKPGKFKF